MESRVSEMRYSPSLGYKPKLLGLVHSGEEAINRGSSGKDPDVGISRQKCLKSWCSYVQRGKGT